MHAFRRRLMLLPLVTVMALSGTVQSVGPVAAMAVGPYGYGTHTGHYGRHWILDTYDQSTEYPAVTCRYDNTLKLRKVSIRPPVVFAYDRSGHLDRQDVAWRAVVEYSTTPITGPWTEAGRTPLQTRSTTDERAASFRAASFTIPATPALPSDAVVRVTYRMWWYSSSTGDINGRATDGVYWLGVRTPFGSDMTDGWCEAGVLPTAVLEPYGYGTHEGHYGAHWILDAVGPHPEYPAVTCVYGAPAGYDLLRLRIRGPIILAYDRTGGPDTRYVGWKARIQKWDGTSWLTIGSTSTSRKKATDTHWPTFQVKTFHYHDGSLVEQIRVVYTLYWYGSDGHTVTARASHYPKWYAWSNGGDSTDSCPNHLISG